jgi:hypothetical protein
LSKNILVEVLIATPPTSKCQETIGILEELVRRHPDQVRLVIFKRGVDFAPDEMRLESSAPGQGNAPQQASLQMRVLIQKGTAVPSCVVNGVLFSSFVVPDLKEMEAKVYEILSGSAAD